MNDLFRQTGKTTRMLEAAIAYKKLNPDISVKIYFPDQQAIKSLLNHPLGNQLIMLGIELLVMPKQISIEECVTVEGDQLGKSRYIDHSLIEAKHPALLKEYFRFIYTN